MGDIENQKIIFNEEYDMSKILSGEWSEKHKWWSRSGKWQENNDSYYIKDDFLEHFIYVNKYTKEVTFNGFSKLVESYLEDGIFIKI